MIHLVYYSSATHEMSDEELQFLLEQSRNRNQRQNVTGMLLYAKGIFIQVLEGEKADVEEIYAAIEDDERNIGNIVVEKQDINERVFPDWSMGFRRIADGDVKKLRGYSEFLNRDLPPDEFCDKNHEIIDLLYQFKKNG